MISQLLIRLGNKSGSNLLEDLLREFFAFGLKQILSCFFPGFIFCMLIISNLIHIPYLPRYDFLLICLYRYAGIHVFHKT
jgi:uncharacterized membrane protein YoaT (DUF817 family)